MGRERDQQSREQRSIPAPIVEVFDESGNKVRIPLVTVRGSADPIADPDGTPPQFVNISGKKQLMTIQNNPMATIPVEPWGILEGAQWRSHSEIANAWGRTPPFIERKKRPDGSFDPVYLLEEDQAIEQIKRLKACDPEKLSYERLAGYEEFAKVRVRDASGQVKPGPWNEDRKAVLAAISQQITWLKKRWDLKKQEYGITD